MRYIYVENIIETASNVLAPGAGARSVSGFCDDTATNPGKGKKVGLGRKYNKKITV